LYKEEGDRPNSKVLDPYSSENLKTKQYFTWVFENTKSTSKSGIPSSILPPDKKFELCEIESVVAEEQQSTKQFYFTFATSLKIMKLAL